MHGRTRPGRSVMAETWEQVLDRFEVYLDQEEVALLTGGAPAAVPPNPAGALGPMPMHLGARAESLLLRSSDLAGRIESAAAAVGRRLVDLRSSAGHRPAVFVDRLA